MSMGVRIEGKVVLNCGQIGGAKVCKQIELCPCLDGFHVFWFLNSVIKLGQLPITEFKVASRSTPVSESFLLSLAFYYRIFLEMRGRDIISLSTQNLTTEGGGQDADSLALEGTVLIWCCTKGCSIHKRNHLETRGVCVLPLIPFINSNLGIPRAAGDCFDHFEITLRQKRDFSCRRPSPYEHAHVKLYRDDRVCIEWVPSYTAACIAPHLW